MGQKEGLVDYEILKGYRSSALVLDEYSMLLPC